MILLMSGLLSNVYSQVEYEDNYEYEEPEYIEPKCPCPENADCNYDENSNDCK